MTSLSRQLDGYRSAVSSQLSIERSHASLLFDKKEAGRLYKENVLKIGQNGLAQLRKTNATILVDEEHLFAESSLHFQRSLLEKEENTKLNLVIERVLIQLSPYLQHTAAHQILEWLIFRYQIQVFNAEEIFINFLPFHRTNIFGRLLSILVLKNKEYEWIRGNAKEALPISFEKIITKCLSSNHSILSKLSQHIIRVCELFSAEYVDKEIPHLFTFMSSLCIHLFSHPSRISDAVIAKVLPFIAYGLKSDINTLRLTCLMITCQMCVNTKLVTEILNSILKLILLKINPQTLRASIDAAVVICQQQNIENFPLKAVRKLANKDEIYVISTYLCTVGSKTNISSFLVPLSQAALTFLVKNDENCMAVSTFLIKCFDINVLHPPLVLSLFSNIFDILSTQIDQIDFNKDFKEHIRSLVLRYLSSFDSVKEEWCVRDSCVVEKFLDIFGIKPYEVETVPVLPSSSRKRRRKKSKEHIDVSFDGENNANNSEHAVKNKKSKEEMQISQIVALTGLRKKEFKGEPAEDLIDLLNSKQWITSKLALEKLVSPKYQKDCAASDFEDLIAHSVTLVSTNEISIVDDLRKALSQVPINGEFALQLLKKTNSESNEKGERKTPRKQFSQKRKVYFHDEDDATYRKRFVFVMEFLYANEKLKPSLKILRFLFDVLKELIRQEENEDSVEYYTQQLVISMLIRFIKNPQGMKISAEDLQLDSIVSLMRKTYIHRTLRDCLKLLTLAAQISPSVVLSQMMSVFTFMGAGLFRKDNDLTLCVIQESLQVIFKAIQEKGDLFIDHLLSISRIFANSIADIPAHRRGRILQVVARAAGSESIWLIIALIFENYCLNWQRGNSTIELFEEMASELIAVYNFDEQLSCVTNLIGHIIRLEGDFLIDTTKRKDFSNHYIDQLVFDRSKCSLQKLRHYRFAIIGWIARLLSNTNLFEKLNEIDDDERFFTKLISIGKKVLLSSMDLQNFVDAELSEAQKYDNQIKKEKSSEETTQDLNIKYWMAFTSRCDIVNDKLRNILPANICGELISNILEESSNVPELRDKALQLLNSKLLQDNQWNNKEGIDESFLNKFAVILNQWIKPVQNREEIVLCQNAAFSLKLITKRIRPTEDHNAFSECMKSCTNLLTMWNEMDETLIGNILLLAGELVRSHNVSSVLLHIETLIKHSLNILQYSIQSSSPENTVVAASSSQEENVEARRKRVRSQSLSGRKRSDSFLICILTCIQRIMNQYWQFVCPYYSRILTLCSLLAVKLDLQLKTDSSEINPSLKYSNVKYRAEEIWKAFIQIETRLLIGPFQEAAENISTEPKAQVALLHLFSACIESKKRETWIKTLPNICKTYFIGLSLRATRPFVETLDTIIESEGLIIDAFLRIVDCLSENDLHPVMKKILKLIKSGLKQTNEDTTKSYRVLTVMNFLNKFYDAYNTLAIPHFSSFFELVPSILNRSNRSSTESSDLLLIGSKKSLESRSLHSLVIKTIDFVTKCAKHPQFFTRDRAEFVIEPLIDEFTNIELYEHEERCVPHLSDCIIQIADAHYDLVGEILNKIVLKTRDKCSRVRYDTLLTLERIFDKIGDAVAPHIPLILPFLSELLEDDNAKVENQCDKVLALLKLKLGDDISDGHV